MIKFNNNNGNVKNRNSVNSTSRLISPNSSLINFNSEKYVYPNQPVRCIIIGHSECGKSVFLTNLFLNNVDEYGKIYNSSPPQRQGLYQKLIKCFSNFMPNQII